MFEDEAQSIKIINGPFIKKQKNRMIFELEEIELERSIYSYQGSAIFDEFLEFFAFLNVWSVNEVG